VKLWLAAALVLYCAACGAYQFPGGSTSPSPTTGAVTGRVLAVPCTPVELAGSPCAGRPVPNLELDYVVGTSIVNRAVTDSNGRYSVDLEPESYRVRMKTYMRVLNGPLTLSIAPGSATVADYTVDSGIRAPVPPVPQQ